MLSSGGLWHAGRWLSVLHSGRTLSHTHFLFWKLHEILELLDWASGLTHFFFFLGNFCNMVFHPFYCILFGANLELITCLYLVPYFTAASNPWACVNSAGSVTSLTHHPPESAKTGRYQLPSFRIQYIEVLFGIVSSCFHSCIIVVSSLFLFWLSTRVWGRGRGECVLMCILNFYMGSC